MAAPRPSLVYARAPDTRCLVAAVVARATPRLKYKFIEYRILSRVLGLSEDPVLKAGMDSIPITAKDSKWKGDMKVRKALEELVALKMVGKQERRDPRERTKKTAYRRDVQEFYYYYVDFEQQLKVIRYRLYMMHKAVEEKRLRKEEAAKAAASEQTDADGNTFIWKCERCEDAATSELDEYRYTDLDVAGHADPGICPAAGCTNALVPIDYSSQMEEERHLKQEMTTQLRVLEDLIEDARKMPAPTVDMLVDQSKKINEVHRVERKELYDDVLQYSMVPGSIATQQEVIRQDFGGALKLLVSLRCAQCGDPTHGWDNKCPVSRSDPAVCCRPFPQNLTIQSGPLHRKRRRLTGQYQEPGAHDGSSKSEPRLNTAEAAWRVLLKLWQDAGSEADVESWETAEVAEKPLLKLEGGGSQEITNVPTSKQPQSDRGLSPVVGQSALLDGGQHCTVQAVSLVDCSCRVRWVSDTGEACAAWVGKERLAT